MLVEMLKKLYLLNQVKLFLLRLLEKIISR